MGIVKAKNLTFEYIRRDEDGNVEGITKAVDNVSIDIKQGDFVAVLGHNGSGKSTFAKHLNALVMPTEGTVWVDGMDTREEENTLKVRQTAGMVFQNPDNQIVGTLVDEEVGFGPENIGVPTEEIWERVEKSLKAVGMYAFRNQSPNKLSGGQKQRVAIAGIVAMKPKCIVLDEPTAMLDPLGRKDVLNVLHELNRQENVTVILITHYMEEVIDIDKLYVMDDGKLVMSGTPREIFSQVEKLKKLRLDVPHVTELAYELQKEGVPLKNGILTSEEFTEELIRVRNEGFNVNNIYEKGTGFERQALKNVSCAIEDGEFIGLIGHTGSGKSTFIQHLNGLVKPTEGHIYYNGRDIYEQGFNMKELRSRVGLVFQYPEHQLFETEIFKDVCFGPKNLGLSQKEVEIRAFESLRLVGIDDNMFYQSPFDLSGGQKRRVAIAGVLAMKPDVLILDEPTAGLDPKGRDDILNCLKYLREETGMTIILVSHSMDDVANYVSRIMVMNDGVLTYDDTPRNVFRHYKELEEIGLAAPQVTYLMNDLKQAGFDVNTDAITIDEAKESILSALG